MGKTASLANIGSIADGSLGFRNRIINGAMVIDQRNAGASVTPTADTYTLDRWRFGISQSSKFSTQQNAGSVTPPAGFINYLGVTSLSAYAITSGDIFGLYQRIEGFNVADLAWGTASAAPVVLSFQVYSSLTGTFGGSLQNSAGNRTYPFTYSISSANTWTTVSVTIAGDTTGTWLTNNSTGIKVTFGLGLGSTVTAAAGAWTSAAGLWGANGCVSVVGTSGATFYITGVQLEKGSTATSFDYRPYGTELQLCQRYFAKLNNDGADGDVALGCGIQQSTTSSAFVVVYPVTMRAEPTAAASNLEATDFIVFGAAFTLNTTSPAFSVCRIQGTHAASGAQYRPVLLRIAADTSGFLSFSAEL